LQPGRHVKFGEHRGDVGLYGGPIELEAIGDCLVIASFRHETEDLDLAGSQTVRNVFVSARWSVQRNSFHLRGLNAFPCMEECMRTITGWTMPRRDLLVKRGHTRPVSANIALANEFRPTIGE
jgi:hypothetical protein